MGFHGEVLQSTSSPSRRILIDLPLKPPVDEVLVLNFIYQKQVIISHIKPTDSALFAGLWRHSICPWASSRLEDARQRAGIDRSCSSVVT